MLDFARQDRRRRLDKLRGVARGGINHRDAAASLSRRGNRDLVHASVLDHAANPLTILTAEELREGDHPRDQMARGPRELLAFPADRHEDLPGAVDLPPLPAVEDERLLQCRVQTHGQQLNCTPRDRAEFHGLDGVLAALAAPEASSQFGAFLLRFLQLNHKIGSRTQSGILQFLERRAVHALEMSVHIGGQTPTGDLTRHQAAAAGFERQFQEHAEVEAGARFLPALLRSQEVKPLHDDDAMMRTHA